MNTTHHATFPTLDFAPMRRLARRLVSDSQGADDLVQETWLAGVRAAQRGRSPERGAPRWFGTVLRNLASKTRRDDARRREREQRSARPEATRATDDVAARVAIQRALAEEVEALDPLYRDLIVMRFFDDKPPRAIARELAVPVETVRTRLTRGVARLRQRLEARGGKDAWLPGLVALARAPRIGPSLWLGAVGALGTTLLVAGVDWSARSSPAPLPGADAFAAGSGAADLDPQPVPELPPLDTSARTATETAAEERAPDARATPAAGAAATLPQVVVRARATDGSTLQEAVDAAGFSPAVRITADCTVTSFRAAASSKAARPTNQRPEGEDVVACFRLEEGARTARIELLLAGTPLRSREVPVAQGEVQFLVSPADLTALCGSIDVRFVLPPGAVAEGAKVSLRGAKGMHGTAHPGDDGNVHFPGIAAGTYRLLAEFPGLTTHDAQVDIGPGEHLDLGEIPLGIASTLAGVLVGEPNEVWGREVVCRRIEGETPHLRLRAGRSTRTDRNGAFQFDGLQPGPHVVYTTRTPQARRSPSSRKPRSAPLQRSVRLRPDPVDPTRQVADVLLNSGGVRVELPREELRIPLRPHHPLLLHNRLGLPIGRDAELDDLRTAGVHWSVRDVLGVTIDTPHLLSRVRPTVLHLEPGDYVLRVVRLGEDEGYSERHFTIANGPLNLDLE